MSKLLLAFNNIISHNKYLSFGFWFIIIKSNVVQILIPVSGEQMHGHVLIVKNVLILINFSEYFLL